MAKKRKNPWIAAVLNLIVPGAGYLYSGKRTEFAIILLAGWIVSLGVSDAVFSDMPLLDLGFLALSELIISLAFAYDGYMTAKAA